MKLKIVAVFYLLLLPTWVNAQAKTSKIIGYLEHSPYTYAYLFLSDRKKLIKEPIEKGKFWFEIDKNKEFETAILYFGLDSNRIYSDVIEKRNTGSQESKIIALDDSVRIYVKEKINESLVIGGRDNKDLNEMDEAIKTGKYIDFFNLHPESYISLLLLKALLHIEKTTVYKGLIDYEKIFHNLSTEMQNSKKGNEIRELLKNK